MNQFEKIKSVKAQSFINNTADANIASDDFSEKPTKKAGRPKGSTSGREKKKCFIGVYVTEEDKETLKNLAKQHRMAIGQYLVFKALVDD